MPDKSSFREPAELRLPTLRRQIENWLRWYIQSESRSPEARAKLPGGGPSEWNNVDHYLEMYATELWSLVPEPMRRELKELEARVENRDQSNVRSFSSESQVPDAYWYAEGEARRIIDRPFLRIKLGLTDSEIAKLIETGKLTLTAKLLQKEIYLRHEFEKLETVRKLEAEQKSGTGKMRRPIMGWSKKPGESPK